MIFAELNSSKGESLRVDPGSRCLPAGAAGSGRQLVAHQLAARLVKTGGRLIKHARYYWLLLAESHVTRRLFGGMLRRIATVASPAG
jgi:hypothetical protein